MIVDVLNQHSTRRTWTIDDVERAHRVGPRKGNSQQPRPLIVRFSRWPDKMAVVQGADLKQNLKDSGIKVAADLTKRQRAEIERVRSEGKFGYYKNGRLHVEDRRTPRDEQDPRERPDQRPSPDEEDERDAGDRQQQGAMLASSHSNDDRDDDDHSSQPTPYRHDTLETPPRRPRDSPHAARGARDGHGQEDGAQHRDASRTENALNGKKKLVNGFGPIVDHGLL
nr:hypothetical protein BaRGS_030282 [Batillaria attramentaria]